MILVVDKLNIFKKIDGLGRVVIPKSIRDRFGIKDGDELEIAIIDGWIGLRKIAIGEENDRKKIAREVLEEMGLEVPKELFGEEKGNKIRAVK